MVSLEIVEFRDVHQEIALYVFILGDPNFLSTFVDDHVLVWVVVGGSTRWGGEEVGEELSFQEDREVKGVTRGSRWGRRWDNGNRGGNNRRWVSRLTTL